MQNALSKRSLSPVATWLLIGVVMIIIQIVLGGITRLTGSGLSITEWKPILGTIPPLNTAQWQAAFEQYKQIGQYQYINTHFTLSDFKFIYFWEWFHRVWARLIGIVFLIPFIYFIIKGYFKKHMITSLLILFLLGGLQGLIGWIMVKSGLNSEDIYVNHIRLAIHFIAALLLLVYTVWFALGMVIPGRHIIVNPSLSRLSKVILVLFTVQFVYGAFMAGLKAATFAPTWPTINGLWIPDGLVKFQGLKNLTDNPIAVHFIHRGLAYLLTALVIAWCWKAFKVQGNDLFAKTKWLPVSLIIIQVMLGVLTVVNAANQDLLLWFGVAHQFFAIVLLMVMVFMLYLVRARRLQ
jgi:cytochrome c oxidase assembly protein subunit 15